jgi:hypothetical protein
LLPALKAGNNLAITAHLNAFKDRGVVKHDRTLRIPTKDRIPALTATDEGYNYVLTVLAARLKQTFDNMNLKRGMNEDQIITLGEEIINESHEDNLSMEDVLLFLQQLLTGKAGRILDRMDIPLFFELFEHYRQERYLALQYIQYEAEVNYKAMGDRARSSDGHASNDENTRQVMADYYKKTKQDAQSEPIQPPLAP